MGLAVYVPQRADEESHIITRRTAAAIFRAKSDRTRDGSLGRFIAALGGREVVRRYYSSA